MSSEKTIEERVIAIIEIENTSRAIERVHGYLKYYYWNQWILNKLAELYYAQGNIKLAGKYWFFKEEKSESEIECVEEYKKSKGNDLIIITRELIGHYFRSPRELSGFAKNELFNMISKIEHEKGQVPNFAKNWFSHVKKTSTLTR